MFSKLNFLLGAMAIIFAIVTPIPEANAQYYAEPKHYNPHYNGGWVQHAPAPQYAVPHGVRRPHRFVCGADIYTGAYNCVRRKKAHFVRPMHSAPAPVYYGRPHHHRHHRRHW